MDVKAIPALIVGVMVAVVMVGAVLPVFAETTDPDTTFINAGYYDMVYTKTDSIMLYWTYTDPTHITINDNVMDMPQTVNGQPRTILCGDNWVIRCVVLSGGTYGLDYYTDGDTLGASVPGTSTWNLTANNGELSITNQNNVTKTNTYTYMYCISEDGPLVMKNATTPAYIKGDSVVYAMGTTNNVWSGTNVYLKITGNIDDGITASVFGYTGDDAVTVTNTSVNYSEVNGYDDLYTISDITVTVSNGDTTKQITYSYYIVPDQVTAEKSVHPDAVLSTLINLLPLIAVAGLLLGGIAWVMFRKG